MVAEPVAKLATKPNSTEISSSTTKEKVDTPKKVVTKEKPARKSLFSITDEIQKNEEKKEESKEVKKDLPKDSFTEEQVKELWENQLNELKSSNPGGYYALTTVKWKLNPPHDLHFTFNSETTKAEFDEIREVFMKNLRTSLNNFHVQVSHDIVQDVKTKHIKTRKDIYLELSKQFPTLEIFRESLDLDIENEP